MWNSKYSGYTDLIFNLSNYLKAIYEKGNLASCTAVTASLK